MFPSARSARHILGFLALSLFAGCGGRTGSSVTPPLGASQAAKSHVKTLASTTASAAQTLFVANSGNNTVTEYALPSGALLNTINVSNLGYNGIAVDPTGNLFVLTGNPAACLLPNPTPNPGGIGNVPRDARAPLYASLNNDSDSAAIEYASASVSNGLTLTKYAPPYNQPPTTISVTSSAVGGYLMNAAGDLFTMSCPSPPYGGPGGNSTVTEYAPPYTNAPIATINTSINGAKSSFLSMDAIGDLFVYTDAQPSGAPTTYYLLKYVPPYTGTPTIVNPFQTMVAQLAASTAGTLFTGTTTGSTLTEFAPPYTGAGTSTSLPNGSAIALDGANNLFIANYNNTVNTVMEYAPPSYAATPTLTISQGLNQPDDLAFGPALSPSLTLTKATTTDTKSVTVDYTVSQSGLESVHFDVYRGGQSIVQNPTSGKLLGSQDVSSSANDTSGNPALQQQQNPHELKLLSALTPPLSLTPDTSNEYIVVVATFNGGTSTTYFRKWMLAALAHGFDREALEANLTLGWIGGYTVDPWETEMDNSLQGNDGYDHVIPFDWMDTCAVAKPGQAQQAGANLAIDVQTYATTTQQQHPGDVVDMHFIGHSRGTVVVTQALQKLAVLRTSTLQGSYVELTLLDPHPANNRYGLPDGNWGSATTVPGLVMQAAYIAATAYFQGVADDPQVIIPAWVNHTDVWWQHTKADLLAGEQYSEDIQNLWGMVNQGPGGTIVNFGAPIPPNNIKELTADQGPGGTIINIIPGLSTSPSGVVGHSEVPYVYLQQVVNPGNLRAPQF